MTAPYSAKVSELLRGSLRHDARVTAHPITGSPFELELEGTDLSVTFDESWSPYVQANLGAVIPEDQARLDALDPRQNCRIEIEAGYTYPDNTSEIFPLADLALRSRDVSRPSDTLQLSAASDEAFAQDYIWRTDFPLLDTSGVVEAVRWCLNYSGLSGSALQTTFAPGMFQGDLLDLAIGYGDPMWKMLDEIALRTGQRVYCDEHRVWQLKSRQNGALGPSIYLRVGQDGTLTGSETSLSRDEWANSVYLRHEWESPPGTKVRRFGTASVTSGPTAVGTVGYKTYVEASDRPIPQATLDKKAATMLRSLTSRGRSQQISAIAAYWLRPGMTVSVKLPTGGEESQLIRAVTFHPLTGLMDITTRQPTDVVIETGE